MGDDNEGTNATRFGTIVHNVCEKVHKDWMVDLAFGPLAKGISDDVIMQYFDEFWKAGNCYDFEIYAFGRDKIADFVRNTISKRLGVTIATEFLFVYEVEEHKVFLPSDTMSIERIVNMILLRGNTPVVSKIDRIDRVGPTSYEVHDYKTNILPFTRDYIENSTQLGLYDLVVRALHPEATEVWCVFDMLRHGRFPVSFTDANREFFQGYFINLWAQIKASEVPEERINKYCRWCEIRSTCAAYEAELNSSVPTILTESVDTEEGITALYDEYEKLGDLLKLAEQRQKEIKAAISAKIVQDSLGEPLAVGAREFYFQPNPRYEFPKEKVIQILQDQKSLILLPQFMGAISRTAVDRATKGRADLKNLISPLEQVKFATPSLKSRRTTGGISANKEEASDVKE